MPKIAPFEEHTERYDDWFETYKDVYLSELSALRRLVPDTGRGIEIGVGGARFAAPLGIDLGIDPSPAMLDQARKRGVDVVRGVAESLPFRSGTFDTVLNVTTICFVDDVDRTLSEAARVLTPTGCLVIGFIDEDSPVGEIYREKQETNPFYRDAEFVTTVALVAALESAGFTDFE
ncbi:MAG: class I SAM-dependent methyltransferase, partial [Natronomonas sp.]